MVRWSKQHWDAGDETLTTCSFGSAIRLWQCGFPEHETAGWLGLEPWLDARESTRCLDNSGSISHLGRHSHCLMCHLGNFVLSTLILHHHHHIYSNNNNNSLSFLALQIRHFSYVTSFNLLTTSWVRCYCPHFKMVYRVSFISLPIHLPSPTTCQAHARHGGYEDKQNQLNSTNRGNMTAGVKSRKERPWAVRARLPALCIAHSSMTLSRQ